MWYGKKSIILVLMTILTVFTTRDCFSQQNAIRLSLDECVRTALEENLNLKSFQLGLQFDNLSILQAQSEFDPSLNFQVNRDESKSPTYFDYFTVDTIDSKTSSVNLGLNQKLKNGANMGFGFNNALSQSNIETQKNYTSNLAFTLNQPLLRGFGKKINQSNIYLARISSESTMHEIENQATNLIFNVENAYWNLVFNIETLKVFDISMSQADSLLAYNKKGFELGIMTESDVLEAQSALLSRQQSVIEQKNRIRASEDALRRLMNISSSVGWNNSIVPSDSPEIPPVDLDEDKALAQALELRPDYKIVERGMEQNELYLAIAQNGMLPQLDLTARYRVNGSGVSYSKDLGEIKDVNRYGWTLGFALNYPLKNRSAKAQKDKQQISIRRNQLQLQDLEQQILADIRESIRNVKSAREKIDVAKLAVEVNQLKLRMEEERFRNQLSTSYYVLEFQRDLEDVQNQYNQALTDYMLAVINLQKSRGTLLKDKNVTLIENKN